VINTTCHRCGDRVAADELVSLTGQADLCARCAEDVCTRPPAMELWDQYGTPRLPHVPCPVCLDDDQDEVGSTFDGAWCCRCGWHGSLTEMRKAHERRVREAAPAEPEPTVHEFTMTLDRDLVSALAWTALGLLTSLGLLASWLVTR
jgi:hypothetical protein